MIKKKHFILNPQGTVYSLLSTKKGVALVAALVITLAVTVLILGTLYVVTQSTAMSGAGKRYATASEAADGSIEVMKASIQLIANGEAIGSLPIVDANPPCLADAVLFNDNQPCTVMLTLPGNDLFVNFTAHITVTRLYTSPLPGNRIEFPRSSDRPSSTAMYYRINATVTGPGGARAETSALYRCVS